MISFFTQLLENDLALLFIILSLGCLAGRLRVAGVELSAAGGVLFVALVFGHFDFVLPGEISSFGFAFFIYAIGFGAGPRFFQAFRRNGVRYGLVALFVALVAAAVAMTCAALFDLPTLILPGVLGGALTSTSTLAAAYELVSDPLLYVAYGITYPFGLIGLLFLVQFLPGLLHIDLKKEAEQVSELRPEPEEEENVSQRRVYQVQNPGIIGVPLRDLQLRQWTGTGIVTIKRGNRVMIANADSKLEHLDHVLAEGRLDQLLELGEFIGPEVVDEEITEEGNETVRVVVTLGHAFNRSLRELRLTPDFGVILTRLQRAAIDVPVNPDMRLERGDIVTLAGPPAKLRRAIDFLGRAERKIFETDIFTFSAGLVLGIVLGRIEWPLIHTSIGNAGGLLFMGITLGYLRNFGPFSGRVPVAARFILQELGLLLFLAGVGTSAGGGLVENLGRFGLSIFLTGVLVTTITLLASLLFCRYVVKFDWNTSFGATTGGVTSTVALKLVTAASESQYAVLGYAGVYAFANILLTLLGQLMVSLARLF